jgi:tetratricopeptide (TPR) repeat protein
MQRDFAAADRVIDRALALDPKSCGLWSLKARLAVAARGDFSIAEKGLASFQAALEKMPGKSDPGLLTECASAQANVALLQRQYPEVLEAVRGLPKEALAVKPHTVIEARLFEGAAQEKLGPATEARAAYTEAKELAEKAVRESPNEPSRHAFLGRALAHLGEKESAITEGKRATQLLPISVDAFEGPGLLGALAEIYALVGENAKAIDLLDQLLSRPADFTVKIFQLDPSFDELRSDPAFQAMLAKHEGNT